MNNNVSDGSGTICIQGLFPAANAHPVVWNILIQTLLNYKYFGWWNFK